MIDINKIEDDESGNVPIDPILVKYIRELADSKRILFLAREKNLTTLGIPT